MNQRIALAVAIAASAFLPGSASGQWLGPTRIDAGGMLQVGGEAERYLRVLEVAGLAPYQPWTVRPLSAPTLTGDHPWRDRWTVDSTPENFAWRWLRPMGRAALNTTFPYEVIRGPVWAGRGLTVQATGGLIASWGRLRLQIEPSVSVSQNAEFELAANGLSGDSALWDARFPITRPRKGDHVIDAPQRFGTSAYSRLDPGNTTLSFDLAPLSLGISTAAQAWGPAREFPLVMSANSGGFTHAFASTSRPIDVGLAKISGRLIAGSLRYSGFAQTVPNPVRWGTGIALSIQPRGIDGLEIGGSRFVSAFSASGIPSLANVRRLFARGTRATLDEGGDNISEENQLASVWFRWAIPRTSTEFYGEYYREDYALDLRWFLQYPDDLGTYVLGLQHIRAVADGRLRAYRFEVVNGELSSADKRQRAADAGTGRTFLDRPYPPYMHYNVVYGHTNRGLFLGSPEAFGGAAARLGVDDYDSRGRTSLTLERRLRFDWLPGTPTGVTTSPDVIFAAHLERVRFVGDREIGVTVVPMLNLNRNLRPGNDKFNLAAALSYRGFR